MIVVSELTRFEEFCIWFGTFAWSLSCTIATALCGPMDVWGFAFVTVILGMFTAVFLYLYRTEGHGSETKEREEYHFF